MSTFEGYYSKFKYLFILKTDSEREKGALVLSPDCNSDGNEAGSKPGFGDSVQFSYVGAGSQPLELAPVASQSMYQQDRGMELGPEPRHLTRMWPSTWHLGHDVKCLLH